jgi:hypothetical protein
MPGELHGFLVSAPLLNADRARSRDDDVINKWNADDVRGLFQSFCDEDILITWCGISGRMVMDDEDAVGRVPDRRAKNFPWVDEAVSKCSDGDLVGSDGLVLGIEADEVRPSSIPAMIWQ